MKSIIMKLGPINGLLESKRLFRKAKKLIPSCTQTFSKGYTQYVQGVSPIFLKKGKGSHVWDVDGNEYIDYVNALLPIILGYNYESINDIVMHQLQDGVSFSLPHPLEIEMAEVLSEIIPCAEMVRFGKNGSDVTSGAVRAARAFTGRDIIACCGYHGWQDWYIGTTERRLGVPKAVQALTVSFKYNNIESLKNIFHKHKNDVAAVIMEPVNYYPPKTDFLQSVRDLTHENGSLLIFDEIITGFRFALGGAQEYFGVIPDMACFGKAMGNGFPISAVVGKSEYMQIFDNIFYSFTFAGEALSLAASLEVIKEIRQKDVIPYLWKQGQKLMDGVNSISEEYGLREKVQCIGYPVLGLITFKDENNKDSYEIKSLFQQEVIRQGILFLSTHNISFSHSDEDIEHTLSVYRKALKSVAEAIRDGTVRQKLIGEPIQPVFKIRG